MAQGKDIDKENTHDILEKGHGIQEGQAWVRDGEKAMAKFVEIFFEIMATNILRYETIGSLPESQIQA